MLGLVQGLTEFLPISSSGHLVLFQTVLDLEGPKLFYDLILHFGTLLSILVYFRKDFSAPVTSVMGRFGSGTDGAKNARVPWRDDQQLRIWVMVMVGSIPTFFLAFLLHIPAEKAFLSIRLAATALIVTGLFLALTHYFKKDKRGIAEITIRDALVIGVAQGLAVFPGISRSGITIAAGMMMGLEGKASARFSFLLSVPAILGALVFKILEQKGIDGNSIPTALVGCAVAFLSGLFAIRSVIGLVSVGRIYLFSFYCIPLGLAVLTALWIF